MGIAVGDTELKGASGRYVTRKFTCQLCNHLVNIAETGVCKFGYHFSLEIGPSANHHLLGYAEQLVCRGFYVTRLALLALLVTEKDEVDDFGIQSPCRGEIYLDIATGDIQPVAMVHAERHFIKVGIAVVLGNGSPRVSERVIAIVVLLFHAHVGAYLAYSDIHVGIEAVGFAVTAVEYEQVFIILIFGEIFIKKSLG